jgi:hypothetical protein
MRSVEVQVNRRSAERRTDERRGEFDRRLLGRRMMIDRNSLGTSPGK